MTCFTPDGLGGRPAPLARAESGWNWEVARAADVARSRQVHRPVIRWEMLGSAVAPGGGELRLMQRGEEFSITIDRAELMNSRRGGSEAALATLGCEGLAAGAAARVLIGGLGMGFTLRAALDVLGPDAEVVVAEIAPAVIAWAHGPLAGLFGSSLSDPRVLICEADVADLVADGGPYDAILLDVDNGPDGLVRRDNDGLYAPDGLRACRCALRAGGRLAVWSAGPDDAFVAAMRRAGFDVTQTRVHAHGRSGPRHVVWLGR